MEIGQKKLEMVAMVIIIVIKDFICYGKVPRRKEMLQQCYVMLNGKKNHAHVVMAKERKKERAKIMDKSVYFWRKEKHCKCFTGGRLRIKMLVHR